MSKPAMLSVDACEARATEIRIDVLMSELVRKSPAIVAAHVQLGISLEDAVCAAVRSSFRVRPDARQLPLPLPEDAS